jgi:hypothetical protein
MPQRERLPIGDENGRDSIQAALDRTITFVRI